MNIFDTKFTESADGSYTATIGGFVARVFCPNEGLPNLFRWELSKACDGGIVRASYTGYQFDEFASKEDAIADVLMMLVQLKKNLLSDMAVINDALSETTDNMLSLLGKLKESELKCIEMRSKMGDIDKELSFFPDRLS